MSARSFALAVVSVALVSPRVLGQVVLETLPSPSLDARFGFAVAGAGDVDLDGRDDVIVGGPFAARVQVISGRDSSVLVDLTGVVVLASFGRSVAGVGDVDGDGRPDVFVGDPRHGEGGFEAGAATVFSGKDGSQLLRFLGSAPADLLGSAIAAAGDVDADGWPDLVVGAPGYGSIGSGGYARVHSGRDGSILHTFLASGPLDRMGISVASAGDVDLDGHADLIVGATEYPTLLPGRADVFSGADGQLLFRLTGRPHQKQFGWQVAGIGDADGDGRPDVAVGCPATRNASNQVLGSVQLYSGADGALLHTHLGRADGDKLGISICAPGDLDGDGRADVAAGAAAYESNSAPSRGYVRAYSGATGEILYTLEEDSFGDGLGRCVAPAGDVDGDGRADLIAGAPYDDGRGLHSGSAWIFSGHCPPPPSIYCETSPNSVGPGAEIGWSGSTSLTANDFVLHVTGAPPGKPALYVYGPMAVQAPFGQGWLCVSGPMGPLACAPAQTIGSSGTLALALDLAQAPFESGPYVIEALATWRFQCWYRDRTSAGAVGFAATNLSNAFGAAFCP